MVTTAAMVTSKKDNKNDKDDDNREDDDDNDRKDYAFQIESEGGPSADPESVDGTVFAGEKKYRKK